MNRAKLLILAALAIVWTAVLLLTPSAGARPMSATTGLSAVHVSDDAMALANLVVMVCANSGTCVR